MVKGVVFDLDGTLLDSQLCFSSIRKILGVPENHLILEYLDTLSSEEKNKKAKMLEDIELRAAIKSKLFPGVQEIFEKLSKNGIRIGILTRNCAQVMGWFLKAYPELSIDHAITRENTAPKPSPQGLHVFLERWKLTPNELLMVGDSYLDMECGINAGAQTVWFKQSSSQISVEVDYIIEHLNDLGKILDSV
ncbi:MAG: HAD family hydrolase [Oligoflexales bacterium]